MASTPETADRSKLTYDWNGNVDMKMLGAHISDFEVARQVRMMLRTDLNHEIVCTLARDRIMALSKALSAAEEALATLKASAEKLLKA